MRSMISFGVPSLAGIAVVLFVLWAANGFHGPGIGTAGTVALVLGILVTSGLGVGLMALVFYSDRSHADDDAYRAGVTGSDHHEESAQHDPSAPTQRP